MFPLLLKAILRSQFRIVAYYVGSVDRDTKTELVRAGRGRGRGIMKNNERW